MCSTSSDQYFSYIQDEIHMYKCRSVLNLKTLIDYCSMSSETYFSYIQDENKFQKRSLMCRERGHVTHYDPRSDFPYCNLTILPSRGHLLSAIWGCTEQLCRFEPWETSPVPSENIKERFKVERELWCLVPLSTIFQL